MLKKAKRLYVLVPTLGLIALSQFAQAAPTPGPAQVQIKQCRVVLKEGAVAGELNDFKIDDIAPLPVDRSKVRNNFKLVLQTVFQKVESYYGPLQAKAQKLIGFSWDDLKRDTQDQIPQIKSAADGIDIIKNLVFKFRDAHVSVTTQESHVKTLPISAEDLNGHSIIKAIYDDFPAGTRKPIAGDEIIAINGMSPTDFMHQAPVWKARANEDTNRALFANGLRHWSAASGVPRELMALSGLDFTIKPLDGSANFKVHLNFKDFGIDADGVVKGPPQSSTSLVKKQRQATLARYAPHTASIIEHFHTMMKAEIQHPLKEADIDPGTHRGEIGETDSHFALPKTFKPFSLPPEIMQSPLGELFDTEFYAGSGIFDQDGKTYGVLRIKSYAPDDLMKAELTRNLYMGLFESMRQAGKIDGLFIDQTSNGGGYVAMSDMVIKSLDGAHDPKNHIRYAVKPTPDFMQQFLEVRNAIAANLDKLFTSAEVATYTAAIDLDIAKIKAAHDGHVDPQTGKMVSRDLSEPVSMLIMTEYQQRAMNATLKKVLAQPVVVQNPKTGKQSKFQINQIAQQVFGMDLTVPQVWKGGKDRTAMLINAKDASGADVTPFTAKEQNLVTLIGLGSSHTMGAGGTVIEHMIMQTKDVYMTLHLTESLMVGNQGHLVENRGAQADLTVPLSPSDLKDDCVNVAARVCAAFAQFVNGRH